MTRTCAAERELLAHADFPVDELRRETGLAGPRTDTVFGSRRPGRRLGATVLGWG